MKLNILGTTYTVIEGTAEQYPVLKDADGACDYTVKKIYIEDIKPADDTVEDLDSYKAKVLRHEITHAFLCESGLDAYSRDELLVDWIAAQAPKMMEVFSAITKR